MPNKKPEAVIRELVEKNFHLFEGIFASKDEMLSYGLKFLEAYGDYSKAIDDFLSISEYYRTLNLLAMDNQDSEGEQTSDFFDSFFSPKNRFDYIRLIMVISLIEKLRAGKEYIDFSAWVKAQGLENGSVLRLWAKYNEEFGCSHKFRNFFIEEQFVTKDEQIELLKSISFFQKIDGKLASVSLFCYDKKKCGSIEFDCRYTYNETCKILNDDKARKKCIKEFASFLYSMRNGFVHDANLISLSEENRGGSSFLSDYVPYKFKYIKRPEYKGFVNITLTSGKIEHLLNRNFKQLLDNYLEERKQLLSISIKN
jgi:hypothetical protein